MLEKRLEVSAEGKKVYDIVIENSFSNLVKELSALDIQERKLCIVTERRVASYYLEEVKSILEGRCAKVEVYIFQEGEVSKNLSTVDNLYHFLITHEFDRKDMLLALGGGVTGDLTGFAAGVQKRGKCEQGQRTIYDSILPAAQSADKAAKAGASLQEVITQALDAARSGVEATKNMIPVFGKAAVHAAQCEGVEDQGAVAGYYKILGLHNYICK